MNVPFDGISDNIRFDFDEREAFAQLFRENFSFVRSVLRRYGVPPDHLDDLGQEVFITAYKRLHTLQSQGMLRSWLFGIARRHAANHRRKLAGMPELAVDPESSWLPDLAGQMSSDTASAERALVQAELLREIDKLSPKLRDTYVLSEIWGFSYLEVGEALAIAPKTATSRLRAARLHMAERARRMQAELERSAGRSGTGASLRSAVERDEQALRANAWLLLVPMLATIPLTPTVPSPAGVTVPITLGAPSVATSTAAGMVAVLTVVAAATLGVAQPRPVELESPVRSVAMDEVNQPANQPANQAAVPVVQAAVPAPQGQPRSPEPSPTPEAHGVEAEPVATRRPQQRWQRPQPEPAEHGEGAQNLDFPAVPIVRPHASPTGQSKGPAKMPSQARALLKRARALRDDGRYLEFQRTLDAFVREYGTWRHDLRYATERVRDLCRRGQIKSARSLVRDFELKSGQPSAMLATAAADCRDRLD